MKQFVMILALALGCASCVPAIGMGAGAGAGYSYLCLKKGWWPCEDEEAQQKCVAAVPELGIYSTVEEQAAYKAAIAECYE